MGLEINARQQKILEDVKTVLPESFINFNGFTSQEDLDKKLLAYADLVLNDINLWPPETNFTTADMPALWDGLLKLGVNVFTLLFTQQNWTLLDFGYSEGGLSLNLDRVSKIEISYKNILAFYTMQVKNAKRAQIFKVRGRGLGTPRYSSQIGQFIKLALGSAFTWNQP